MADLNSEIREQIYRVLEGELSVLGFEDWFVRRTWDERTRLVASVDHLLAEKTVLSNEQICEELRRAVTTIEETDSAIETGATAETLQPPEAHLGGTETIRRHLEFADT